MSKLISWVGLTFLLCLTACSSTRTVTPPPASTNPDFGQQNTTIQTPVRGQVQSFEMKIQEIEAWRTQDAIPLGSDEVKLFFLAYVRNPKSQEANIYRGAWAQADVKDKTIYSADCNAYKRAHANESLTCIPLASLAIRFDVPEGGNANLVFRLVEADDDADFALAAQSIAAMTAANRVIKVFAKTPGTMLASEWISYTLLAANYGVKVADQINTDDTLGEQSDAITWQELQNVANGRYRSAQEFQGNQSNYYYKVRYSVRKL